MYENILLVTNIYIVIFSFSYLIVKIVNNCRENKYDDVVPVQVDNLLEISDKHTDNKEEIHNYDVPYRNNKTTKRKLVIRNSTPIFEIGGNLRFPSIIDSKN